MADQPQGVAAADNFPEAVLVKLGEEGLWSRIALDVDVLKMDRMSLLKALKHDEAFAVTLRDVALSSCAVKVCVSASKKGPSIEEEAQEGALEGAETLGDIVTGMGTETEGRPYLYIRVALPQAGGESEA